MISTHINQRLKALSFLSKVLANIVEETTQHSFNKDQLGLLASFYTDRYGLCNVFRAPCLKHDKFHVLVNNDQGVT